MSSSNHLFPFAKEQTTTYPAASSDKRASRDSQYAVVPGNERNILREMQMARGTVLKQSQTTPSGAVAAAVDVQVIDKGATKHLFITAGSKTSANTSGGTRDLATARVADPVNSTADEDLHLQDEGDIQRMPNHEARGRQQAHGCGGLVQTDEDRRNYPRRETLAIAAPRKENGRVEGHASTVTLSSVRGK